MSQLYDTLEQAFPDLKFQSNFPLSVVTYFKLGGPAEVFFEAQSANQILELVQFCRREDIVFRLIGGASNVIAPDEGLRGLTIKTSNEEYEVLPEPLADGRQIVRVGVGYKTGLFVRRVIDEGLAGLEKFLGVPGCLGGAIFNNAHYLADLIGDHIHRVQVITPESDLIWLPQSECGFAYDYSRFQETGELLLQAEFALAAGDKDASMAAVAEATRYRATTQPLGEPSSGCIFQNVPNSDELRERFPEFAQKPFVPGGFLIDQAGLKGASEGGIEVSQKHAAFFVNKGNGTAADVAKLVQRVKNQVNQQFGVSLREEVFYLR